MTFTHPDRLFPIDSGTRAIARALYQTVAELPIISPYGHCDPRWFAENKRFPNPAELFIIPDHYVFRMLSSQGIPLSDLGVPRIDGGETESDPHASDHGHLTARTENMPAVEAEKLFQKALKGECSADESDAFRGQMLTEMARMSLDDGLVLQIHPGSYRNHSAGVFAGYGRDKGFDIPKADAIEVAHGLAYGLAKKAYRL